MLLKLPQDVYERIKDIKGDLSHQTFIVNLLKQELLTKSQGELKHGNKEKDSPRNN
jgi:hypothetical protein